jgi:acetolactate synthase I/II/III large subunit
VIYAGGGVVWSEASAALREFATRAKVPVAMTVHGLGCFPADHYLSLEMIGMHGTVFSNYAVDEADLLLAFGVRFDDRVTGKLEAFCQHGKIVHIDIDPSELNKNKTALLPIASDLRPALEGLNERLRREPLANAFDDWHRQIDEWKSSDPMGFQQIPDMILPQQAIKTLWEIIRDRGLLDTTIVTTGVGQHQMFTAQHWKFMQPRTWFTSGGLGTMGFGLPAAMGAQAAFPDRICIDVDGDGSFLMNIQELATCKVEKLPVKVLLLNNQHLGMVVQWEDRFFKGNRGHTYLGAGEGEAPYPDFVTIAKGFGVAARQIRAPGDLRAALEEMLDAPGPYVLDVLTPHQEHVLPMIPSGMTVKDMIKV